MAGVLRVRRGKNLSYNGSIAAGGTLTGVGFTGTWSGTNPIPTVTCRP